MEQEQRTVMFTRKSANLAELQEGTWSEGIEARGVAEYVIELPPASYARFTGNLLADHDFLREHQHEMYVGTDGEWHCLLVKAQGAKDGILVMADGYSWARYSAYCPDSRPYVQEAARKKEGGEIFMQPHESRKQDRLFFVSYEYTESGESHRCGFVCEARSIRAAAEAFWSQHPLEPTSLGRV